VGGGWARPGPRGLTRDLHHAVLGLDRQLLGGEVVDVQGDAPAVGSLLDLRDAAAELPAEQAAVGGRGHCGGALDGGRGQRAHVARPAAVAQPLRPLLGQPGQPEGLVEEAAVGRVPVAERVPAGAPQERERHTALSHAGCAGWTRPAAAGRRGVSVGGPSPQRFYNGPAGYF
uniref:Uncharacterized protein n=1 Tax=Sus scrofa TaxID=9823 RepID=A0A8D0YL90_PIG